MFKFNIKLVVPVSIKKLKILKNMRFKLFRNCFNFLRNHKKFKYIAYIYIPILYYLLNKFSFLATTIMDRIYVEQIGMQPFKIVKKFIFKNKYSKLVQIIHPLSLLNFTLVVI